VNQWLDSLTYSLRQYIKDSRGFRVRLGLVLDYFVLYRVCRVDRKRSSLLLRHCCWCGRGLNDTRIRSAVSLLENAENFRDDAVRTRYCNYCCVRKLRWVLSAVIPHRTNNASDTGFSLRHFTASSCRWVFSDASFCTLVIAVFR